MRVTLPAADELQRRAAELLAGWRVRDGDAAATLNLTRGSRVLLRAHAAS